MTTAFKLAGFGALLALAACGEEKGPGGVTADEQRRLENAASMVDGADTIVVPDDSLSAGEPENAVPAQDNSTDNRQ